MSSFKSLVSQLLPLWLFLIGVIAGTQFSLDNYPVLLILSFAAFYRLLWIVKHSLSQSLIYSYSFGYGFFVYSHSWISHPLTAFGDLYASIQPIVFVMVPAILGLYFLLIGTLNYLSKIEGFSRILVFTILTVLMEYIRCEYAPAVPLGQIGSVLITYPKISQGAAIFGVYGLSFITVLLSYGIGSFRQSFRFVIIPSLICIVLFLWGSWRVSTINLSINDDIFRIVPTSWAQTDKYRALESRVEHLKELVDLSFVDSKNTPILILWPETTIEFALLQREWGYDFMYPEIKPYLQHMLTSNTFLLAGIVLRTPQNETYNIVFGVPKTGDISYVYKKRLLAPFGEFMPTGLRSIANTLGIHAMDDFNRGTYDQSSLLLSNGLRVNTLICYEGSFSGQVIQPYQSVDLFTVSTNDAWFGYNGKEQQFISHAFRAIEEGVPMIRSANRGFSGYVSPIGTYKVSLSKTPLTLKIHKPLPQQTPYRWLTNRCTYWLELVFSISLIYILIVEVVFRRRKRP